MFVALMFLFDGELASEYYSLCIGLQKVNMFLEYGDLGYMMLYMWPKDTFTGFKPLSTATLLHE